MGNEAAGTAKTTEGVTEGGQALQLGNAGPKSGAMEVGARGLQLSNLGDAWQFCNAMAQSGMMPKGMETAQKILYALELGFEVGLPPLAAVQSIAVINGRASLYGDVMLGLVIASGKWDEEAFDETIETDAQGLPIKATCTVRRLPNGKPLTREFSLAEAKLAGLAGKEGPWRNYPRRMLQMRARGFALRDGFPDVLKGIISREEANDLPPEKNVTPAPVTAKPTNLEELTSQITASSPAEETAAETATTEPVGTADPTPAQELAAAATSDDDDPMPAIKASINDCKYVTDVNKVRATWCGFASKLSDAQKWEIGNACDERIAVIKNKAKKSAGDEQGTLV